MNTAGLEMNLNYVLAGILIGVNVGLLIVVVALLAGVRPLRRLNRQDKVFFTLWILPAMATFILGHTGQLGYILLLLPALFLLVGVCLEGLGNAVGSMRFSWRTLVPVTVIALFALVNTVGFVSLPHQAYSRSRPAGTELESSTARSLLQYDISASDEHWRSLAELVRRYDPDTTVVLTTIGGPRLSGSFRHASYLLPEYRVYGLGDDINGSFGYLFRAQNGHSNYSVEGLQSAMPWLPFGQNTLRVIIPDEEILSRLGSNIASHQIRLESGAEVAVAFVPSGAALNFAIDPDRR